MNKLITISSALLAATAIKAQSPNVIFILADDLGYGDISAFNPESKIHTPNIDNLTHSGISFTDAHSSSALSPPSRYSSQTIGGPSPQLRETYGIGWASAGNRGHSPHSYQRHTP